MSIRAVSHGTRELWVQLNCVHTDITGMCVRALCDEVGRGSPRKEVARCLRSAFSSSTTIPPTSTS